MHHNDPLLAPGSTGNDPGASPRTGDLSSLLTQTTTTAEVPEHNMHPRAKSLPISRFQRPKGLVRINNDTICNRPTYPSVQRWEEAATRAVEALTKYYELSLSLEQRSLSDATPPTYLAGRIDSILSSLHTTIDLQISEARSTLSRVRNRIRTSIYCFPREILAEIFTCVVSSAAEPAIPFLASANSTIIGTYRQLHTLLAVCSTWRNIALNQTELWTTIPIVNPLLRSESWMDAQYARIVKSSMKRAGSRGLHLAVTESCDSQVVSPLKNLACRFHTVHIDSTQLAISEIMNIFLRNQSPGPLVLSQLSLRLARENRYFERPLHVSNTLFGSPGSHEQRHFTKLILKLSALRISGVQLDWGKIAFSQRLTKLLLHNILLGRDSALNILSKALSTATELRDLKLISIRTFYDFTIGMNAHQHPPIILLPNLQTFVVQDLYFNTLSFLFSLLDPSCSHRLTLVLNEKGQSFNHPGIIQPLNELQLAHTVLLHNIPLKTLYIDGFGQSFIPHGRLSSLALASLIRSAPALEALYLRWFSFDEEFCRTMKVSTVIPSPRFTELYLHSITIHNKKAFKAMITSHLDALQYLELGGSVVHRQEGSNKFFPIKEDEELVAWLEDNVLNFQIVYGSYCPSEFDRLTWQLW